MRKLLVLSNPAMLDHGISAHPENAERLRSVITALEESPYKHYTNLSLSRLATRDELSLVQDTSYVDLVLSLDGKEVWLDPETFLTSGSVNAALLAAGLGLELVDQVLEGKIQSGFFLGRPPGHHARPAQGMGYCVFNNIAIAAKKALSKGIKRILILDWDVHHGNGTQEMFYDDDRVLFIDLHQENLFPSDSGLLYETGKGEGLGFTVNIPLPAFCHDEDYFYAFETVVKPLALEYSPELILVSSGFDAHESDPLGSMHLTTRGYGHLTAKVKSLANEVCEGKVLFFLEGGYDPYYLAKNVLECIRVLANETEPTELTKKGTQPLSSVVKKLIDEISESHVKNNATI